MNCVGTAPVALSMKNRIEDIRLNNGMITSAYAFATLYIWQRDMGLSVYLADTVYAVKCAARGANAWLFPCGEPAAVRAFVEQALREPDLRLCYLREADRLFLEREFPGRFRIAETPGDDEYLYDRAEQEALAGKKFAAIRNHIRRAEAEYAPRCEPLCAGNIAEAIAVNRLWERRSAASGELGGSRASELLLREYRILGVSGVLIRVGGEPYAVAAGYPLSAGTFDMSLAKQKENLPGLGAYAKHAFIRSLPVSFSTVNAEEDLGVEGLRAMKYQMRPGGAIKTYEGRAYPGDAAGQ